MVGAVLSRQMTRMMMVGAVLSRQMTRMMMGAEISLSLRMPLRTP